MKPGAVAQVLLGAGSAAGLAIALFDMGRVAGFRWLAAAALVLLSAYLCLHLRASLIRARFLLLLVCFAVMALAAAGAQPALPLMLLAAFFVARASGELAGLFVLFQPGSFAVPAQGWLAPLALAACGLALWKLPRAVTLCAAALLLVLVWPRFAEGSHTWLCASLLGAAAVPGEAKAA